MQTLRNIFLIGPMGSGKTAVGKCLAGLSGLLFVDSDDEIVSRTGAEIPLIFEKEGEIGFRERECGVIADLTAQDGVVLSTGGGAILSPKNREVLRTRGVVVYLETSVAQQVSRIRSVKGRPLLTGGDPMLRLTELMAHRRPLYAEIAHLTVQTDRRRVRSVAEQIMRELITTNRILKV